MISEKIAKAKEIVEELCIDYKIKAAILSGSAARGKENPNDLDIGLIVEDRNPVEKNRYLVEEISNKEGYLEEKYGVKVHLFPFPEYYVGELIKSYNSLGRKFGYAMYYNQLMGLMMQAWPLSWIIDNPKDKLFPYSSFQEEFIILFGKEYLDELKLRIR